MEIGICQWQSRAHQIAEKAEEVEEKSAELLEQVNGVLSDVYMDKLDDLESAVRPLVEEYEEAVEEARA